MPRTKTFLVVVILLVFILAGVVLGIDNHTPVALRFLDKRTPELQVFWWLYMAFGGGALAGFALCFFGFVRGKLNERRLKRALAERERELDRLRASDAT